jgi:pimeloyl-ACP methyl ester carboxylesterase
MTEDAGSVSIRTRRGLLGGAASLLLATSAAGRAASTPSGHDRDREVSMTSHAHAAPALPHGIRQRSLAGIGSLTVNVLEAGYETPGRPAILLLHGFPDLAYSWRHTMLPLAAAGYHVIAPDQRGYGATTGWDGRYDGDLASFRTHSYARDALGVLEALGHRSAASVVGHDFGSMIAAYCALVRPDVFRSLVMMSFPFDGPPAIPFDTAGRPPAPPAPSLAEQLASLPRPRQDSMAWFGTRGANEDMLHAPQGLHAFLRAYFHVKSADWPGNRPHPLATGSAAELATLPTYYIMDRGVGMAATVAPDAPSQAEIAANRWLPEEELAVYTEAFRRTGFQGGLNWFRCHTGEIGRSEIELFAGRSIDVPASFIAGVADWGIYRKPGAIDRMRTATCSRMEGVHLIEGAGHWVQQEQPDRFNAILIDFLKQAHSG